MHFVKQASLLGCALSMAFVVGLVGVSPAQAATPRRGFSEQMASSTPSRAPLRERFNQSQGSHLYGKVVEVFPDRVTLETSSGAFFGVKNKKEAVQRVVVLLSQAKQERLLKIPI